MPNPIEIRRGQSFSATATAWATVKGGATLNLTGATLAINSTDLPFNPALAITNAAGGQFTITMTPAQTALLTLHKRYVLQLKLTTSTNEVRIYPQIPFEVVL